MISNEKLTEFRKHLKSSDRPLFIYDNDPDGLCSFLVLRKYVDKGKGLPVPHKIAMTNHNLIEAVEEYGPDLIVLLDTAVIEHDFVDNYQCKILLLDHHPLISLKRKNLFYYNPRMGDPDDNSATSYWAYKIAKTNFWVAFVGMVADWYIDDQMIKKFMKEYPDILKKKFKSGGQANFDSELSEIIKAFTFCLKGNRSTIEENVSALIKINHPSEIFEQKTKEGKLIYDYYQKKNKRYEKILNDILESHREIHKKENFFLYTYVTREDSFSSILAGEIIYRLPEEFIIIARVKGGQTVMSLRSKKVSIPDILDVALEGIRGGGGGHKHACGAYVDNNDFPRFIERIKEQIS